MARIAMLTGCVFLLHCRLPLHAATAWVITRHYSGGCGEGNVADAGIVPNGGGGCIDAATFGVVPRSANASGITFELYEGSGCGGGPTFDGTVPPGGCIDVLGGAYSVSADWACGSRFYLAVFYDSACTSPASSGVIAPATGQCAAVGGWLGMSVEVLGSDARRQMEVFAMPGCRSSSLGIGSVPDDGSCYSGGTLQCSVRMRHDCPPAAQSKAPDPTPTRSPTPTPTQAPTPSATSTASAAATPSATATPSAAAVMAAAASDAGSAAMGWALGVVSMCAFGVAATVTLRRQPGHGVRSRASGEPAPGDSRAGPGACAVPANAQPPLAAADTTETTDE
jgi:hypothetical protein